MIFVQPPNKQIHDETLKMVNPFEVLSVLVDYCPGNLVLRRGILMDGLAQFGILLMEEILHLLISSFSHYLQGFIHPR